MMSIKEFTMSTAEVARMALRLSAAERSKLVDLLLRSLDEPNPEIDSTWANEAEKRLQAIDEGRLAVIPLEEALAKR